MRHEREIDGELYVRTLTFRDFQEECVDGWGGVKEFESATGCTFSDVKNDWWTVIHNRVYLLGRPDALGED